MDAIRVIATILLCPIVAPYFLIFGHLVQSCNPGGGNREDLERARLAAREAAAPSPLRRFETVRLLWAHNQQPTKTRSNSLRATRMVWESAERYAYLGRTGRIILDMPNLHHVHVVLRNWYSTERSNQ